MFAPNKAGFTAGPEQIGHQCGGCCFSIGSRDGNDGGFAIATEDVQLPCYGHPFFHRLLNIGQGQGDAGAGNDGGGLIEHLLAVGADPGLNTQGLKLSRRICHGRINVRGHHPPALGMEEPGHGGP